MNAVSVDRPRNWKAIGPERQTGLEIILLKRTYVFPWSQFLYAEGGGDEIQAVFTAHDLIVRRTALAASSSSNGPTRYNKDAMAIHLEAVYEQGVLRPLEPLALAEHQRVRVTVDERKRPLSWESAQPIDEGRAELEWLANESRHYPGEWVALDGNRLIAHGSKLAAVKAAAQAAGVSRPFFASVPDDDLPFGGW